MNHKKILKTKTILREKIKNGGIMFPEFKQNHIALKYGNGMKQAHESRTQK